MIDALLYFKELSQYLTNSMVHDHSSKADSRSADDDIPDFYRTLCFDTVLKYTVHSFQIKSDWNKFRHLFITVWEPR
jgi:hypothetical protein